MFKTNLKALNSYFAYTYNDFKKVMITAVSVCAGIYILQLAVIIIISQVNSSGSSSNSSVIIAGTVAMLITFMIGVFVNTANGKIQNVFRFPINRPTYALGNLLYVLIVPLAIIAAVSVFFTLESLTYKLLSLIIGNVIYLNSVTISGYLEGIIPTYATIVFALSVIYMLSMYFHRYKLPFVLLLALFLFSIITFPGFRLGFSEAFTFGFKIKSILPFTLYMLGASLVAHLLAFIPLKIMEVK